MSFTSTVKDEVSKLEVLPTEYITELSAIIHNIGIVDKTIKIKSENASVARHIFSLIKDRYQIIPKITVRQGYNFNKNFIYILEINSKIDMMIKDLSLDTNIPKEYIYADDDLIYSYLRGLFLSVGSINDP